MLPFNHYFHLLFIYLGTLIRYLFSTPSQPGLPQLVWGLMFVDTCYPIHHAIFKIWSIFKSVLSRHQSIYPTNRYPGYWLLLDSKMILRVNSWGMIFSEHYWNILNWYIFCKVRDKFIILSYKHGPEML